MKKNKWISISFALLLGIGTTHAQTVDDAVRFSQNIYEGTARFQAMGGAFAALGGDFTSLSINPGGVGVYRNYEMMMTPTVTYTATNADYLGSQTKDSRGRFGFSNAGFVGVYTTGQSKGLVSFNYAFGYNKLANFTGRISAQGRANNQSQLRSFANSAHDIDYRDLGGMSFIPDLAYNTLLIDTLQGSTDQYIGATDNLNGMQGGPLRHNYYRDVIGNVGEYVFTLGGNVSNKFYFGMTVGIQSIDYSQYESYSETAVNPSDFETNFRTFTHRTEIDVAGTGMNLKFGAIYRPVAGLRIGAYIHTPTWMWLTDLSSARMDSDVWNNLSEDNTPISEYDYRINAPFKWGTGLAYTFGSVAVLSVDYEGVDYASTKMYGREDRDVFAEDNEYMQRYFTYVSNVRVGAEVRLKEFSLRGGYAFYGTPEKDYYYDQHIASVGAGYANANGFFIDAAYSFNPSLKSNYQLYNPIQVSDDRSEDYINSNPPTISADTFIGKIILTLGFRF